MNKNTKTIELPTPEVPVIGVNSEWPLVSFGIGLGDTFNPGDTENRRIDFDVAKYAETLREANLTSEQIAGTSVSVIPREKNIPYDARYVNGVIQLPVGPNDTGNTLDGRLTHETVHRIQDAQGRVSTLETLRNLRNQAMIILGRPMMYFGGAVTGIAASEKIGGFDSMPLNPNIQTSAVIAVAGLTSMICGMKLQRRHPLEVEAYSAESSPLGVVSISGSEPHATSP